MACPNCGSDNKTNVDNKSEQRYSFERWSCDDCNCVWTWTCLEKIEEEGKQEDDENENKN